MTAGQADLFRANRRCWVLGERADREQYALLSAQGIVRQAIEIGGRRAIVGSIASSGVKG
ncbi:hypothetical protein [Streptomyces sp. NBC_01334]|uniref:hypothetical protein n=1 Tax=Streptomyces sp. NBC_01334 TaxID=2903827 RepID=UPI002E0E4DB8|nr:hypothetical protein OG736_46275 [Streptomyces sp. NBC_01334]